MLHIPNSWGHSAIVVEVVVNQRKPLVVKRNNARFVELEESKEMWRRAARQDKGVSILFLAGNLERTPHLSLVRSMRVWITTHGS